MLDKLRDGAQSIVAKVILVLVILSFAFAGVSSYMGSGSETAAAIVNGEKISKAELDQAYQSERNRLQQQLGDMFDTLAANDSYLNSVKQGVLQRLVAQRLINQAANELGLRASDEQIKEAIRNESAFQTAGTFDNNRYLSILRQMGYTVSSFRDAMRGDMTRNQLVNALVASDFALKGETEALAKLQAQTRDIRFTTVDAAPFVANVSVSDDEVSKYYEDNKLQFQRPEMVSLEYIELSAAALSETINVSDSDAKAYYDEHVADYQTKEKRQAAHILIEATTDDAAAKAKAEELVKQLKAGADYAELAKKNSQDSLTADKGGELGWFEAGVMDPAFDSALFALNKGEVSDVVKTPYGYHIIKLLDVQPSAAAPFETVKAQIVQKVKMDKAVNEFYTLQPKLADTSYEVPDTLEEAAKAVKLPVKTTELFSKADAPVPFNAPEVLKAAFSDDVLSGMNSNVLDVADNDVMVVRVKQHEAAGLKPFAEVKDQIAASLKQQKANEQAKAKAEALLAAVKAGDTSVALEAHKAVARNASDVDSAIVAQAFKMAKASEGLTADVAQVATGYAVVVVDGVNTPANAPEELVSGLQERLASQYSQADYRALIELLKSKAEITYPEAS
ncbi:peptidylprolyl isomerase [Shewanella sp. C32]|uniref:Periplasmic chaperone PpiD n=1 Tax=Shewanella electrica TaxID=515560 RepID=A0ABT2FGR5_9GAMM|nr:peptidylprolyl isomerase [Shewanella electrica]MCH1923416.1 peptidylprolyl isomerase [Shewanella electrica]MCS4555513.1 peptidylprolyl isomerase [Shewanella electrica]